MKRGAASTAGRDAARRVKRANAVAAWANEPDATPSKEAVGLAALPLTLLKHHVLYFLATPVTIRDGYDARAYERQLSPLRAVCRRWNRVTQQLLVESDARVQKLRISTGDAKDRARILETARANGEHIRELAILMGAPSFMMWSFAYSKAFRKDELMQETTWWEELFACYPHLERLDLKCVEFCFLETVLGAASTMCPQVQSLEFEGGSPVMGRWPEAEEMNKLNAVLSKALRHWHQANGGLRAMRMPPWVRYDNAHAGVLKLLSEYCPKIEYLPTWCHAEIARSIQATPRKVPDDVWAEFCLRCSAVREFSWNLGNLTAESVTAFAATPKPQLEWLEIEFFVRSWTNAREFALIQSLLASVPTLRTLKLSLCDASQDYDDSDDENEEDEEDEDEGAEEEGAEGDEQEGDEGELEGEDVEEDHEDEDGEEEETEEEAHGEEAREHEPLAGGELDEMVLSIASHCPRLERFECKFICDEGDFAVGADALDAVAGLPSLRQLAVDLCRVNANSLVDMLSSIDSTKSSVRVVKLETVTIPHTAIANVLSYLAEESRTRFVKTKLEMSVSISQAVNVPTMDEDDATLLKDMATVNQLVVAAKQQHVAARCDVEIEETSTEVGGNDVEVVEGLALGFNVREEEEVDVDDEPEPEQPPPIRRSSRRAGRS